MRTFLYCSIVFLNYSSSRELNPNLLKLDETVASSCIDYMFLISIYREKSERLDRWKRAHFSANKSMRKNSSARVQWAPMKGSEKSLAQMQWIVYCIKGLCVLTHPLQYDQLLFTIRIKNVSIHARFLVDACTVPWNYARHLRQYCQTYRCLILLCAREWTNFSKKTA